VRGTRKISPEPRPGSKKKKVEKEGKRWERGVGVGEKNILLLLLEKKGFYILLNKQ